MPEEVGASLMKITILKKMLIAPILALMLFGARCSDGFPGNDQLFSFLLNSFLTDSNRTALEAAPNINIAVSGSLFTAESGTSASFNVTLATAPSADVTIPLSSSNPAEGTVSPASLVFTSANWNVPQLVTITGVDDATADGNIPYQVILSPATSADSAYNSLDAQDLDVLNLDDDAISGAAGILVSPSNLTVGEDLSSAQFSVALQGAPIANVVLCVAGSNNLEAVLVVSGDVVTDPSCPQGALIFSPTNWSTPKTVTVQGVDDSILDGNQVVTFTVSPDPNTSDPNYVNLTPAPSTVTVTNLDNETAGLIFSTPGNVSENGTISTFTMRLQSEPTGSVTVTATSLDTSEALVSPNNTTFTAGASHVFTPGACPGTGNWCLDQTFYVRGEDDVLADGPQSLNITLTANSGGTDPRYDALSVNPISIQNSDNDSSGVAIAPAGAGTIPIVLMEGGASAGFTVTLASQPASLVKFCLAVSDATAATIDTGTGNVLTTADPDCPGARLEFTTVNYGTAQTVNLLPTDDQIADGIQNFTVGLTVVSADPVYGLTGPYSVSGYTQDNDTVGLIYSLPADGTEGGAGQTFTVRLQSEPLGDVTVTPASLDTGEGTVSGPLTFTAGACPSVGNWCTNQTVTVTPANDLIADGNQTYTITLTANSGGADLLYDALPVQNVSATTLDNETAGLNITGAPLALNEGTPAGGSFTIALTAQPTALVKVCLSVSDTTAATLNTAPANILTTADPDCPGARLEFTTVNYGTAQTVTILPVDDFIADGAQLFNVNLTIVSTDPAYNALVSSGVSGSTADNETGGSGPGFIVTPTAGLSTSEISGIPDSFTVRLNTQPTSQVKVCLRSSDLTEVAIVSGMGQYIAGDAACTGIGYEGSLIFDSTNWNAAQEVFIIGLPDNATDGNIGFTIQMTKITTDPGYSPLTPTAPSGTNLDAAGYSYRLPGPYVQGDQTMIPDGCTTSGGADNIGYVELSYNNQTSMNIKVLFYPAAGGYTTTDGLDLVVFFYNPAGPSFTEIRRFTMVPADFTANAWNSRSFTYALPPLLTGDYFIRASLIDRYLPGDLMTGKCASGSSGTNPGSNIRNWDNADQRFRVP